MRIFKIHPYRSVAFVASLVLLGCTVSIPVGTGLFGGDEAVVVTFGLGQSGIFTVTRNVPTAQSAQITDLTVPDSTPSSGALVLRSDDVIVTPLDSAQGAGTGVTGSVSINFRIGPGASSDPCSEGTDIGSLELSISDSVVTMIESSLALPPQVLVYVLTGRFTLCIEVMADFDATISLNELGFNFTGGGDGDNDNASGTADDDTDIPDSGDDSENETNANVSADENANTSADDDNNVIVSTNDNTDATSDDNSDNDTDTDDGESPFTYTNLTNSTNLSDGIVNHTDASSDASGQIVAYRANWDRTGEADQFSNYEVRVLAGLASTVVTITDTTVNGYGNTVDVTNWGPVVSRDGSTVAFASDGDLLNTGYLAVEQIYLYDVAAGSVRQLSLLDTAPGTIYDRVEAPRISANANRVAWIEHDAECPIFGCASQSRLRVTDGSGNDVLTVVFDDSIAFNDYTLSGDGQTIAFTTDRDPVLQNSAGDTQLFLLDVSGGDITQLTFTAQRYAYPGLSYDGSFIAVWTNDTAITPNPEHSVLALLDGSGAFQQILAEQGVDFGIGDDDFGRPRITPDGRYVAFRTSYSFGYGQSNFRADTATGELLYVGGGLKTYSPGISDDGRTMIIVGLGDAFVPDQSAQNPDFNDEVWRVEIAD